jgi:hypothetical protein
LAKILGKPPRELPQLNVSNYDEKVPESLRDHFYADYPLLKRIYDFAAENHRSVSNGPSSKTKLSG